MGWFLLHFPLGSVGVLAGCTDCEFLALDPEVGGTIFLDLESGQLLGSKLGFAEAVERGQFDLIELEGIGRHFLGIVELPIHGLPGAPDDQHCLVSGLIQFQLDFDVQSVFLLADGLGGHHSMLRIRTLPAWQHHSSPNIGLGAKVEDTETPAVSELEHSVNSNGSGDQDEVESISLFGLSDHEVGVVEEERRVLEVALEVGLQSGDLLDGMRVKQQIEMLRPVSVEPFLDFQVRPEDHQLALESPGVDAVEHFGRESNHDSNQF